MSGRCDRRAEHFPGMDGAGVQRAQRHQIVAQDAAPRIEDQDDKSFFARIEPVACLDIGTPISRNFFRCLDTGCWCRAFAHPHDSEF